MEGAFEKEAKHDSRERNFIAILLPYTRPKT